MLKVTIPAAEFWDELREEFVRTKETTLQLEHSLISISKWESRWKKPFLSKKHEKTSEESLDYIRCMTITQNVNPLVYSAIPPDVMSRIMAYLDDPMSATTFGEKAEEAGKINRETITSEVIYYWMVAHQIPFECEKWPINRLINLIQVCNIKNSKPKAMSAQERAALNMKRRKRYGTKG